MPSPGIPILKTELSYPFTIEGGFSTSIQIDGEFNIRLATAMDLGWTCSTPTVPSQMENSIISEFSGYVSITALYGTGWEHLLCIGRGIDQEISAWISRIHQSCLFCIAFTERNGRLGVNTGKK